MTTRAAPGGGERRHDLDALRAFAMLLGIALHGALSFIPEVWPVTDSSQESADLFGLMALFIHGFRMPLFFLMSGFFTAMLWRRRGLGAVARQRFRRVFLPLVLGSVTVVPVMNLLIASVFDPAAGEASGGVSRRTPAVPGGELPPEGRTDGLTVLDGTLAAGSLGAKAEAGGGRTAEPEGGGGYLAPRYWDFVYSDALEIGGGGEARFHLIHTPLFHHLWFLWFLCWLAAGFLALAALAERFGRRWPPFPSRLVVSPRLFAWALPLTAGVQWFMGIEGTVPEFGPDTATGLIPPPHLLAYYAIFFAFGALLFGHDEGGERITRGWPVALALGILLFLPAVVFTFGADDLGSGRNRLLAAFGQAAYAWLMTLGLMGLFRAVLRRGSYAARYLSDSAYWLYVAHLPVVLLAQHAVARLALPAAVKFAVIGAATTGALLLVYRYGVRYTPIGALLNGRRARPARSAAPASSG